MDKREKFTSKLGFVMACIGSALDLVTYGCFHIGWAPTEEQHF